MAFRREALLAINGFDPHVPQGRRRRGRLLAAAAGRACGSPSPRGRSSGTTAGRARGPTCKQQAGYGEAEALLHFKHPDQFNGRGDGKWRGRAVRRRRCRGCGSAGRSSTAGRSAPACSSASTSRARPTGRCCPRTLEWHAAAAPGRRWPGSFWPPAWVAVAGSCSCLSLVVAALQAAQARLPPEHDGLRPRLRRRRRCATPSRWSARGSATGPGCSPTAPPAPTRTCCEGRPRAAAAGRRRTVGYWSEEGVRPDRAAGAGRRLPDRAPLGQGDRLGWSDWDLEVYCHPWTVVQVCTAQEDHGGGKRLIRVRYRLRPSGYMKALGAAVLLAAVAARRPAGVARRPGGGRAPGRLRGGLGRLPGPVVAGDAPGGPGRGRLRRRGPRAGPGPLRLVAVAAGRPSGGDTAAADRSGRPPTASPGVTDRRDGMTTQPAPAT